MFLIFQELDEWVSNGLQPFSADITRSLATKLNLNIKDTVILTYGKKSSAVNYLFDITITTTREKNKSIQF